MKDKRQALLTCMITVGAVLFLIGIFVYLENGFRNKTACSHMNSLITAQNNIDVLVVGDSQASYDFLPNELWNEYGMTSYVLHANNNDVKRFKYMADMALEYCNPKLIVLSSDQYWVESSEETLIASFHEYADAFPLSLTKIQSVCGLFSDTKTRTELLFPFLTYHFRWKELSDEDFDNTDFCLKGSEYSAAIESAMLPNVKGEIEAAFPEENSENLDVICDFIQHFEKKGIPVIVVTFPFEMSSDSKKLPYLKALEESVTQQNADYYNFAVNHQMFDADTDFKDGVHLNTLGSRKMTSYLGNLFQDVYQIPSHFGEADFEEEWNADYQHYLNYKNDCFKAANSLESALLLGCDSDYNTTVYLKYDSPALRDGTISKLIRVLAPFERLEEARDTECSFLGIANPNQINAGEGLDPSDEVWSATLGGENALYDGDADAYVAIFNTHTGEHITTKCFRTNQFLSSVSNEVNEE